MWLQPRFGTTLAQVPERDDTFLTAIWHADRHNTVETGIGYGRWLQQQLFDGRSSFSSRAGSGTARQYIHWLEMQALQACQCNIGKHTHIEGCRFALKILRIPPGGVPGTNVVPEPASAATPLPYVGVTTVPSSSSAEATTTTPLLGKTPPAKPATPTTAGEPSPSLASSKIKRRVRGGGHDPAYDDRLEKVETPSIFVEPSCNLRTVLRRILDPAMPELTKRRDIMGVHSRFWHAPTAMLIRPRGCEHPTKELTRLVGSATPKMRKA